MAEPLACTLTDAAEMERRLAGYRRLGRDALLSVDREPRRAVLRFRPDPDVRRRVEDVVAAESECCAFLGYQVEEGPAAIVLTLTAPEGGEKVLAELAAVLAAETEGAV